MTILYVTGCDARYFVTTLAVLESLRARVPAADVRVCDFGLTDGQRDHLRAVGWLLDRPASLPPGTNAYLCKGYLSDYLAGEAWNAVLWVDSDMLLGALDATVVERLAASLRAGGKALAATGTIEHFSIGQLLGELRDTGFTVAPAYALVERLGVDPSLPYVHSGLILWVSRERLADWSRACAATPPHALWEQNVLAAVVMQDPASIELLDAGHWQVYDAPLADVQVPDAGDPHTMLLDGRPLMTVHATSRKGHHLDANLGVNVGPYVLEGYMRMFANPALQRIQLRNLAVAALREPERMQAIGVLRRRA